MTSQVFVFFFCFPIHQWIFLKANCYEINEVLGTILLGSTSVDRQVKHFSPYEMLWYVDSENNKLFCLNSLQIGNIWSVTDVITVEAHGAIKDLSTPTADSAATASCVCPEMGWWWQVANITASEKVPLNVPLGDSCRSTIAAHAAHFQVCFLF